MALTRFQVQLQDTGTGVSVSAVYLLDPASGSTTLQASVWNALVALNTKLQADVAAAQPTLPPMLT